MSKMLDLEEPQHFKSQNPAEENLNTDNWGQTQKDSDSLPNIPSPNNPSSSLKNEAIVSLPEQEHTIVSSPQQENAIFTTPKEASLGQVVPLEPMGMSPATLAGFSTVNLKAIRTDGDHLGKTAIAEVNQVIEKLAQTGDVSSFYDEARAMTGANLENSFNRKIGEQ